MDKANTSIEGHTFQCGIKETDITNAENIASMSVQVPDIEHLLVTMDTESGKTVKVLVPVKVIEGLSYMHSMISHYVQTHGKDAPFPEISFKL